MPRPSVPLQLFVITQHKAFLQETRTDLRGDAAIFWENLSR